MFYTFMQNGSGGSFTLDSEVTHMVIVEAGTADEANAKAESIGIYFDGYGDCSCCGDRWSRVDEEWDAEEGPCVYGTPVEEWEPLCKWMPEGKEVVVHYADGKVTWY